MPNYDDYNLAKTPLAPGERWVAYHDTIGFTRLFGTVVSPLPVTIELISSDQEVDKNGVVVCDANIANLDYYVVCRRHLYEPEHHDRNCKFFEIPAGRWLRVSIVNISDKILETCDINIRASVF